MKYRYEPWPHEAMVRYADKWIEGSRQPARGRQPAQQSKAQAGHDTRQAQDLEAQARSEHSLAAKVTDPKLKELIRNSATGKVERAEELKTGQPVKASKYEARLEYGQPSPLTVK